MSEHVIARVTSYDALLEGLLVRKDELELTFKAIDALANFPDNYSPKIFGAAHIKNLGPLSMESMLDVLCSELWLVRRPDLVPRLERRRANLENDGKRLKSPPMLSRLSSRAIERFTPDVMRAMSKLGSSKGGHARAANLSPSRRRIIARRAARCMWAKRRMAKKAKAATPPATSRKQST